MKRLIIALGILLIPWGVHAQSGAAAGASSTSTSGSSSTAGAASVGIAHGGTGIGVGGGGAGGVGLGGSANASNAGNKNEIPPGLTIDSAYLEGFLGARYSEEADFDPDSPANQLRSMLGLNKQGMLTSSVSMYGNRYPWQSALDLFGAVSGAGAQAIE